MRPAGTDRRHDANRIGADETTLPLPGVMAYSASARPTSRRILRILVAGLLVVIAPIAAARGYESLASRSSPAASPVDAAHGQERGAHPPRRERGARAAPGESPGAGAPRTERRGALAAGEGAVPDGTTVFDDEIPGVANLDPSLLRALRRAATDAADDGVEFFVNSGWRSPEYQGRLFREAVSKYGSEGEAARWVATPNTSAHVSGDAVDVGFAAAGWLSEHGARYGLCRIYRNELWHYELRREAIDQGCPPMYADPTHDPRMRR